ncbi:hypothetical protein OAE25_03215 [Verrucomicrobiales bacterium]|nr:hypothetical protein [Verrucomicrobiales bacterium]
MVGTIVADKKGIMSATTTTKKKTNSTRTKTTAKKSNGTVSTDRLKSDVLNLAEDSKRYAVQTANSLAETTKDAVNDAKESVVEVANKSQKRALSEYDRCVDGIKKNPVAAVGIAAGVGLALGIFFLGRRS